MNYMTAKIKKLINTKTSICSKNHIGKNTLKKCNKKF